MFKQSLIAGLLLTLVAIPLSSPAQTPAVTSGLNWLSNNQTVDGNWPGVATEEFVATATAADALYLLSPAAPGYGKGVQWLEGRPVSPTDLLARRIVTLARAGRNTTAEVAQLLALRDAGGGWGGDDGYLLNTLDTALALSALKVVGYQDDTLLATSLKLLATAQIPSSASNGGGFGFYPGAPASTYVTALTVETLCLYQDRFPLRPVIDQGLAFLRTNQNLDHGFGSSPSTVHETALSLSALVAGGLNGSNDLTSGSQAIDYLTTTQSLNGSWRDDPYATALALRALGEVKPDLAVTAADLSVAPAAPLEGTSLIVTARLRNRGLESAGTVVARLYDGNTLLAELPIANLAPGAESSVDFPLESLTPVGAHSLAVTVALIAGSELRSDNNRAELRLWVTGRPDLALFPEALVFTPAAPLAGTATTLSAWIPNRGESPVGTVNLTLYHGDPRSGGSIVAQGTLDSIAAGSAAGATLNFTPDAPGTQTFCLAAAIVAGTPEVDSENNLACKSLTVRDPAASATTDLALAAGGLRLDPARPHSGEATTVTIEAMNLGAVSAVADLELFDGAVEQGGTLIKRLTLTLNPGESRSLAIPWSAASGRHTLVVYLDRRDQVVESDETNNRLELTMMSDMVDVLVSANDLVIEPSQPLAGDAANVTLTVHNAGIEPTGSFAVALYNGAPTAGGALLQSFDLAGLDPDATAQLVYPLTAARGTYRFYVVADSANAVSEFDEGNNLAIRSLLVKDRSETKGPDLVPLKIELYGVSQDTQTLRISGAAGITVQNQGDDKVTTPYRVTVFEDRNHNGAFDADLDNILGTWDYTQTMWPNGVAPLVVPINGVLTFRDAPLYAMVDSNDDLAEANESNNLIRRGSDCEKRPAKPIEPVMEWKWNKEVGWCASAVMRSPVVANMTDDNGDGRIDENDTPDLIFLTPSASQPWCGGGAIGDLHVIDGKTGAEVLYVRSDPAHPFYAGAYLAVGDINNDGFPEIILPGSVLNVSGLLCFSYKGQLLWDNLEMTKIYAAKNPPGFNPYGTGGAPVIADVDSDGQPEILFEDLAINSDGSVKWVANRYNVFGMDATFQSANVADLDLDGKNEVVSGNRAYRSDGSLYWADTSIFPGVVAIGNLDDDIYPEIAIVSTINAKQTLYVLEHDGAIKWGPIDLFALGAGSSGSRTASPPTVADFDGDGQSEIGITLYNRYLIFDRNGNIERELNVGPGDSSRIVATVFDLNNDGRPEILIHYTDYFRIFDGKDGTLLFEEKFGARLGSFQAVIVADVDNDNQAEIVVSGGDGSRYIVPAQQGIKIYGAKNGDWANTRRIWNQSGYHVTNVNDDGSIPQYETPSWLLNNTYNCNIELDSPAVSDSKLPDLTAAVIRINMTDISPNATITTRIGNGGAKAAKAGVSVTFYDGDPAAEGTLIGTALTSKSLSPGDYEDISLIWNNPSESRHILYVQANADPTGLALVDECNEANNLATLAVVVQQGAVVNAELSDPALNSAEVGISGGDRAGSVLQVSVPVRNLGSVAATNVAVRLYLGDPQRGGVPIDSERVIPQLAPGESVLLSFAWQTPTAAGTNYLYLVVDPDNTILEASEANNQALKRVELISAQAPDLEITVADLLVSPATPVAGETVTVTATLHNLGTEVGEILVALYDGDPAQGGIRRAVTSVARILATGSSATVVFALDSLEWSGAHTLYIVLDPENAIVEENEANNRTSRALTVTPAGVQLAIATGQAAYGAQSAVPITLTVTDLAANEHTLVWEVRIEEPSGLLAAMVGSGSVSLPGNGDPLTLPVVGQTGTLLSGDYRLAALLRDGNKVVARATTALTILPDKTLRLAISGDRLAYGAHEVAELTATITSASSNYLFAGMQLNLDVVNPQGVTVLSDSRTLPLLMPGQTLAIKTAWNTAAQPKGLYTLRLRAAIGTESLATAAAQVEILGTSANLAGVTGTLSAMPSVLEYGDNGILAFTLRNQGNEAVQGSLSVLLVDPDTRQLLRTLNVAEPLQLAVGAVQSGQLAITADLGVKDYLAVLRLSNPAGETTLAGIPLHIKDETPPQLSVISPTAGEVFGPLLTLSALADDRASGIARVEYRLDENTWGELLPDATQAGRYRLSREALLAENGVHTIVFRAIDLAGNVTESPAIPFTIELDNLPPITTLTIDGPQFHAADGQLLTTAATTLTLIASDEGTGVAATLCRFDADPEQPCTGTVSLATLAPGAHRFFYRSIDQAGNGETEQVLDLTRIEISVETTPLSHARVLVWTEASDTECDHESSPAHDDFRKLLAEALNEPNLYYTVVTDHEAFRQAVRSGNYTVIMILRQDVPLDTSFQRELREAVQRGTGLLVAHWKKSIPPLWQEVFGVDFKGSLPMNESEHSLHLYAGPLSEAQELTTVGRVLRTRLDGGELAGIVASSGVCRGVRSLTLRYPTALHSGDRVTATLTAPFGKRAVVIDEETLTLTKLPSEPKHRDEHQSGALVLTRVATDGLTLKLSNASGYLDASYGLTIVVNHPDGSRPHATTTLNPDCSARLLPGAMIGDLQVVALDEERSRDGDDLPAVVLGRYGEGKTVFIAYDLLESAKRKERSAHLGILRRAAFWLAPPTAEPHAGGMTLLETRIKAEGADLNLRAVESFGASLVPVPLFSLSAPSNYTLQLKDGETGGYRYFVRFADQQGDYVKTTELFLADRLVDRYFTTFHLVDDSFTLLTKAQLWIEQQSGLHPEATETLQTLRTELGVIISLNDADAVVEQLVQTLTRLDTLAFDGSELRGLLNEVLRIKEGKAAEAEHCRSGDGREESDDSHHHP